MHYQKEKIVKELFIKPMILSMSLDTPGAVNGHEDGKIVAFNLSEEIIENKIENENNVENNEVKESKNEDDDMNEEESDASNIPTLEEPITRCGRVAQKPTRYPYINIVVNSTVYDHVSNVNEMIIMNVESE